MGKSGIEWLVVGYLNKSEHKAQAEVVLQWADAGISDVTTYFPEINTDSSTTFNKAD